MSRICKLSIRGVRNFDDENEGPVIHFSHPLTLILGPNGTGKTTIIECLRYAFSGEFPPDCKQGAGFIHDPMLKKFGTVAVRGNVKAKIIDCRGDALTISRTIEAQRNNGAVKFKTLDSALSRVNKRTREKTMMSGTCASVDMEMMSSMGVSKAILNYVLFCHQDDANWPIEAGKKLKDRFDEIFDTTRYNKALETIRKIIKDKENDLKVFVAEKRGLTMVVEEVHAKRKKLADYETRKKESREKLIEFTNKLLPINQRIAELKDIEMEYCKWQVEEGNKRMKYKMLFGQAETLKSEIKDFYEGSIAELKNEIASYEEVLVEKNKQITQLESDVRRKASEETSMTNVITERKVVVGTLRQQMNDQTIRIAKRNEIFREIIASWELNERIGSVISEKDAVELMKKLEEKLRQMEQEIEAKRLAQDQELDKLQQKVNTLRSEKTTILSQLANSRNELDNVKAEIRANCALLKQSGAMEKKLNDIDAKLAEANKKFVEFNKSSEIDSLKCKIQDATIEEEICEHKHNQVEKEIILLREQSSLQMKFESCNTELMEKENEIEALRKKHGDTLEMLLGKRDFPSGGMIDTINEIQTVLNDRIKNLRKEIDAVQYESMELETSLKHKKQELEKKKTEVEAAKEKVAMHCGQYEDYHESRLFNAKKLKDMEDKRGMYAYQGAAYKEYIKKLSEPKSCCPLCHRGFDSTDDAKELITELNSDMSGHPERLKNCERELNQQRKKYDALLKLQSIVEKVEHFEWIELDEIRQEIEDCAKLLSVANEKGKRLQESLAEPERKLSVCKNMVGDMALWDRYANEIDNINVSIIELQECLRDAGLKSKKTIQEVQTEQSKLQQTLKDTRREIKNLQATLDSRNEELRRVTESRTKLLEEQLRINKGMQDIKQAKESLDSLRSKETSIENNVQSFEENLIKIGNQCEAANKNLEHTKKNIRTMQDFDRNVIRERGKEFDKVNSIQAEVKNFVSKKIEEQLVSNEEKIEAGGKIVDKLRAERLALEAKIAKIKQDIVSNDTRKRCLTDNLTLRQTETELAALKVECDALRKKLERMNYKTVSEERQTLCEQRDDTERERNRVQGSREELKRNIAQICLELEKHEYHNAETNYKKKCAQLTTNRLCIKDLTMYCKVLDSAMIEYHEERMATVNKCMKKLWDLIYTGTDTTSIQIRTEATTTSGQKRQFNYKLVQIKHGVEMDMKGRCSAGQKVLACIILRLAVAETFCEKCCVLALDEPTTNLDAENARSLAEALHSYVNRRAKLQKNFQLIVITHDDNFIPKLGHLSSNNSFYQLYRKESGLSGIKCVSLSGLTGSSAKVESLSSEDENDEEARVKRAPPTPDEVPDPKRPRKKFVFE